MAESKAGGPPSSKLNAGASAFVPRANESSSSSGTPVMSAAAVPPIPPPQAGNHAMVGPAMGGPGSGGASGLPTPSFRQPTIPPRAFQPSGPPSMPGHHNSAAAHRPPASHHVQVGYSAQGGMFPQQPMGAPHHHQHHQAQYPPPPHMGGHMHTHMTAGGGGGGMGHHHLGHAHSHNHNPHNYNAMPPPHVAQGAHLAGGGGAYAMHHPPHPHAPMPHMHHPHHVAQPGHHMMGTPPTLHSHHHHHMDPRSAVAVGSHPLPHHSAHSTPPQQPLHSNHHTIHQHSTGQHQQQQHQHAPALAPDRSIMSKPPAEVPLPIALVVVCTGTMEAVKSEVCHLIEEQFNLRHIALEDEYKDDGTLVCGRLEILEKKLTQALSEASLPSGFVIENAIVRSKHEIFLVDDMLQRLKIRLEAVVLLDNSGASVDSEDIDRIKHPVGFEVCSKYLTADDLVVLNTSEAFSAAEAMEMIQDKEHAKHFKPLTAALHKGLDMPAAENLAPGLLMERNASQTALLLRDVATTLGLSDMFSAPSVVAARVLEYSYFTRRAHFLRSYQGHVLRDGERVTVVGWHKHVYVLTGPTGVCFRVSDTTLVPPCLKRLLENSQMQQPLAFVLGGVLVVSTPTGTSGDPTQKPAPQHRIYLHEVFYLLGRLGSQMYLTERIKTLQDVFHPAAGSDEPSQAGGAAAKPNSNEASSSQFLVVEPYYDLKDLSRSLDGATAAQGLVLVNPGYLLPGTFERLNYVWWSSDWKNIEVRLWNGQLKSIGNGQWWVFDAMVLDPEGKEVQLKDPVLIEDDCVTSECLNDGNIVECKWTVDAGSAAGGATGGGPSGSAKAGKQQAKPVVASPFPSPRFSFVKRRPWSIYPVSKVFADAILSPTPTWPIDSIARATAHLEPLPITLPEIVREKREFDGEDD